MELTHSANQCNFECLYFFVIAKCLRKLLGKWNGLNIGSYFQSLLKPHQNYNKDFFNDDMYRVNERETVTKSTPVGKANGESMT